MKKIRVLVIDEDILARQAVANVLQNEPALDIRVSGDLENVEEVVQNLNPDILLLNLEHSESNGLAVLKALKTRHPDLPVVVLTPRTKQGAALALYALRHGAFDFITKPEQKSHLLFAGRHLVKRLRPAIDVALKLVEKERVEKQVSESLEGIQQDFEAFLAKRQSRMAGEAVDLVTVGASTGGPETLFSVVPDLPSDLSVPVVIVQHFPRHYTRELARSLNEISEIQVDEAYDGVELVPGTIWLVPGGYHAEVHRNGGKSFLKLHRGPRENGVRPSIDLLFRSASRILGQGVLGVILSGCGSDGIAGARSVREYGGKIIVQDPRTALASSLPLSVIKSGLANNYYPTEQISDQIIKRTSHKPNRQEYNEEKGSIAGYRYAGPDDFTTFRNREF